METTNAAGEAETRAAKWKQQPVMTIVTTLALGLKNIKTELTRIVDAWKELATLACHIPIDTTDEVIRQIDSSTQNASETATQKRMPFHN